MNILAIDTANSACSVILKKNDTYFLASEPALHQQAELLLPFVDKVLKQGQLELKDCDCLAFSAGPASFTSIRVALSALQGLALPNHLPIVAVDSLKVLAQTLYTLHSHPKIMVCTNAHMGELFWARYQVDEHQQLQAIYPPALINPRKLPLIEGEDWVGVGNGWDTYPNELSSMVNQHLTQVYAQISPADSARAVVDLAVQMYQIGEVHTASTVNPLYLRTAEAWKTLKK
jgi:tRNA threonylcarbamoyladenosine biosynthesis protein TsaB